MSISFRIKLLSAVLIMMIALASSAGIWSMKGIGNQLEDIAEQDIPLTEMLAKIEVYQLQQEVALEKMLRAAGIKNGSFTKELAGGIKKLSTEIDNQIGTAENLAERMITTAHSAEAETEATKVLAFIKKIEAEAAQYYKETDMLIVSIETGNMAAAEAQAAKVEKEADELGHHLEALLTEVSKFTESAAKEAEQTEHMAMKVLIGIFAGGVLIGIIFSMLIGRSITKPLDELRRIISGVVQNKDLTLRVPDGKNDEIGHTAQSFNGLMTSFQQALGSVSISAELVAVSAEGLAASSKQVSMASQSQAESTSAMAAAVEEMTVSVSTIADNAKDASARSDETKSISLQGSQIVEKLFNDIHQVAEAVRQSSGVIGTLGQRSQAIQGIVNVIRQIADQTNLLALNAAIEAARAGEQGRGFAVVADEVRKLAERSGRATVEIAAMIDDIQEATTNAVDQMSAMVLKVDSGATLAREAGSAIEKMTQAAEAVANSVTEVSMAIREQSAASNDLAQLVESIAHMTEENSSVGKETATSAITLGDLAAKLKITVREFRTV